MKRLLIFLTFIFLACSLFGFTSPGKWGATKGFVKKSDCSTITEGCCVDAEDGTLYCVGGYYSGNIHSSDWSPKKDLGNLPVTEFTFPPYMSGTLLDIDTPYGTGLPDLADISDEIVHPSLIHEPNGWNGYKFWLAYTPYPGADSDYENPCIIASNDFVTWEVPTGLTNPIIAKPGSPGYNADVHITLSPDKKTMYMMYAERDADNNNTNKLNILHSTDGVTWSTPVTVKSGAIGTQSFSSPSFWHNGTNWVCIYHDLDEAGTPIEKIETSDDDIYGTWGSIQSVTMTHPDGGTWWHSFFVKLDDGNILGLIQDGNAGGGALYMGHSVDDGDTVLVNFIDEDREYYRSTFAPAKETDNFDMYVVIGRIQASDRFLRFVKGFSNRKESVINDLANRTSVYSSAIAGISGPLAVDDFARANSTTSLGSEYVGQLWTNTPDEVGISSEMAYNTDSSVVCEASLDLGVTDYTSEVKFSSIGGASDQMWYVFRMVDSTNLWRIGQSGGSVGNITLQEINAGGYGDYNLVIAPLVVGDRFKVECYSNNIKIYRNSLLVQDIWDDDNILGSEIALRLYEIGGTDVLGFGEFFAWE